MSQDKGEIEPTDDKITSMATIATWFCGLALHPHICKKTYPIHWALTLATGS